MAQTRSGHLLTRLRQKSAFWRRRALPCALPFLPRGLWRILPGSSQRFGPPRRWAQWSSYLQRHQVAWLPVVSARAGEFSPPFWPRDGTLPLKAGRHFDWPEQGVAMLEGGRIVSADGWCIGRNDTFIGDFCFRGNRNSSSVYEVWRKKPPRFLPGVTLNLCSQHAAINFCHWALDAVARLELVDRAGIQRPTIDQVVLPQFPGETADWITSQLGLPASKLIRPSADDQFECEVLMQPSYPGTVEAYPPWVVQFYRRHFRPAGRTGSKRFYIPRRGRRGLVNEAEVEDELSRHGFEVFDPAGQTDLHLSLGQATHVVGIHGAALANLVFCAPGTRVLELVASDMPWRYFYSLCSSADLPYGVLMGKSLRERRPPIQKATHAPFHVPVDQLRPALQALLAS
ncbi:MAG: glycosyltransferase family 61 protein [Opitutus sp.]